MNAMNTLTIAGEAVDIASRSLIDRHGRSRSGSYMHTASGLKYWPFDPRADEVEIETIAHQLAGQNRWQGAVRHKRFKSKIFLSVAEHSVMCASYMMDELKRPDLALEALLHDASEAYIGDLIRPLKYSPKFRAPFLEVEEINEVAIAEAFNLVYPFPPEVKQADEAVCSAENEQCIYHHPYEEWDSGVLHDSSKVAPYQVEMLNPFEAMELFLRVYHDIVEVRETYRPLPQAFRV